MPRDAAHRLPDADPPCLKVEFAKANRSQNSSSLVQGVGVGKSAEKVSPDPHFKNLQDVLDHPGTFWILVSTCYDLGHTHRDLGYYLGRIVGELGRGICLSTLLYSYVSAFIELLH